MAKETAGVRPKWARGDDDPVDSFFEVPAAVLCATCGQADCPGCVAASETESGVIAIIPFSQRPFPKLNVGDVLTGVTSGPVEYSQFGGYTLFASELGTEKDNGLQQEVTRKQRTGELAVATYNVENLSPADTQAKYERLAHGIVTNLATPDIVNLVI